ncbi:MAG: hypothetical protein FWF60_04115 [Oscillospiraceae bacterium]|nr:hypothetical protein [Oscillospiraceae bacterium]
MKKALSVLLAAAAVLSLAAPMAFAVPAAFAGDLNPATATLYLEPDPADPSQKSEINVYLPASHTTCDPDALVYWDVMDITGNVLVGFRPQDYDVPTSRPDNTTWVKVGGVATGADMYMTLFARAAGTVTVYAECQGRCHDAWQIAVTIIPPEEKEKKPDSLLDILKTWWFDLKWTWDFQIHPFFKYVYFNFWGWIVSAWNMLVNWIGSLFA